MRVVAQITGDLRTTLETAQDAIADANRAGVTKASTRLQADLRSQVRGAGLGNGLEKAWRMQLYPTGRRTLRPAGLVYSKSTALHSVFSEGATIRAHGGKCLVIPTHEAEALGFAYTSVSRKGGPVPGGQERHASQYQAALAKLGAKNFSIIRTSGGRLLVIYQPPAAGRGRGQRVRGKRSLSVRQGGAIPLFILVPQVRITKRLDLQSAEQRAQVYLADEVESALAQMPQGAS